jgi:hypothetical protein
MGDRDSLAAVGTLIRSPRARAFAIAAAGALWSAFMAAAGWLGGKVETKFEVDRLSGKVDVLTGEVAALKGQQRDLVDAIAALSSDDADHPGPIFVLGREARAAQRGVVAATAIALAYETPATKAKKRKAAEPLVEAFEHKIDRDRRSPSDAAELVIAQIATP